MKILLIALSCFWSLSLAHGKVSSSSLPVISAQTFTVGSSWVWKYYEDNILFSTEKYTVLESSPTRVLIEMSTRLRGEDSFRVHHRLEANPERCLKAYKNSADFKPWSIALYYWNNNQWNLVEGLEKTLAFEEKFNCNPHVFKTPYRETLFEVLPTDFGNLELFQQRKARNYESSWFFNVGGLPGIMAYKKMSLPGAKTEYYSRFSLTE